MPSGRVLIADVNEAVGSRVAAELGKLDRARGAGAALACLLAAAPLTLAAQDQAQRQFDEPVLAQLEIEAEQPGRQ
jgi:hypothetical protein